MNPQRKKIIIVSVFLGVLVVISLLWANHKNHKENLLVSGTVQVAEVQFGSRQGGRISEVVAKEGQILKKGERILTIDAKELLAERDQMKATIDAQRAYLEELKNGSRIDQVISAKANFEKARADYELTAKGNRREDILSAKAAMESAKAERDRAKRDKDRKEALFINQLISKDQLDQVSTLFESSEKKYQQAQENYNKVQSGFRKEEIERNYFNMKSQEASYKDLARGTRPEKLEAEASKLKAYEAQLAELETRLDELQVISPCNCELSEFEIEPGTLLLPNQVLGTLIDLNDIWVDAYLPEEVYGRVWPGDKVDILSLSYPNKHLYGRVRYVGLKAEFTPRNIQTIEGRKQQVFKVKVALNNDEKLFRPGMDLDMQFHFRDDKK